MDAYGMWCDYVILELAVIVIPPNPCVKTSLQLFQLPGIGGDFYDKVVYC